MGYIIEHTVSSCNSNPPLQKNRIFFEKLDKIRISAMRYAEKNCRKLKTGAKKWSLKLQRARDKIKYLALSISKKSNRKVGTRLLIRLSKKTQMNVAEWKKEEIETELTIAYKEYKKIK